MFSEDNATTFPNYGPHNHAIEFVDQSKPSFYGFIYSFSKTKLAILQAYID